jgi:hypothetical protein
VGDELLCSANCDLAGVHPELSSIIGSDIEPGSRNVTISMPWRYWRLAEMTFLRIEGTNPDATLQVVGHVRFAGSADFEAHSAVGAPGPSAPVWIVDQPAPRMEAASDSEWTCDLPPQIVDCLLACLSESAGETEVSQSDGTPPAARCQDLQDFEDLATELAWERPLAQNRFR